MAKITWLGEDEIHGGGAGPSFTTAFGGIKFPKGEAVDVSDKDIVAKAKGNRFFKVANGDEEVKRGPGRPPLDKEPVNVKDKS